MPPLIAMTNLMPISRGTKKIGDLLYRGLPTTFLGDHAPSDGAFYLYADVSALTHDSVGFAGRLLAETGVAITPGVDFDACNGKTHVRLSYAGSTQDIKRRYGVLIPGLQKPSWFGHSQRHI